MLSLNWNPTWLDEFFKYKWIKLFVIPIKLCPLVIWTEIGEPGRGTVFNFRENQSDVRCNSFFSWWQSHKTWADWKCYTSIVIATHSSCNTRTPSRSPSFFYLLFTVYLLKLDTLFFFNNSTNTHHRPMKPFGMRKQMSFRYILAE